MKKVALFYSSKEGQTAKIAEAMSTEFEHLGVRVDLIPSSGRPWDFDPRMYDGVVVGASVHFSRYPTRFKRQLRRNIPFFHRLPSAFFSVCLGVMEKDSSETQAAERGIVQKLFDECGWCPDMHEIFAGAIRNSRWEEVRVFARSFAKLLATREEPPQWFPKDFISERRVR